jgi:hypothetical protein
LDFFRFNLQTQQTSQQESNLKHKQQKLQTPKPKAEWVLLYLKNVSAFCATDVLLPNSFGKYQNMPAGRALGRLYLVVH